MRMPEQGPEGEPGLGRERQFGPGMEPGREQGWVAALVVQSDADVFAVVVASDAVAAAAGQVLTGASERSNKRGRAASPAALAVCLVASVRRQAPLWDVAEAALEAPR